MLIYVVLLSVLIVAERMSKATHTYTADSSISKVAWAEWG